MMAPPDLSAAGRERKIRSIIEFAVDLHSKLPSLSDATTTGLLLADVSHHIDAIISFSQKNTVKLPPKTAKELERHGRDLWNLCVRLKRDKDDATVPQEEKRLVVRTRVFGFHILSLGRKGGREKKDVELEIAYLINLALMVGRVCVADSDLEAARTVLQKAAELVEQLKSLPTAQPRDDIGQRMRLEAEYLALRTALSWKENKLDVAEHMFAKTEALRQNLDVESAEKMADTLHHIGLDLSSKGDHSMAVKWLKRANDLIHTQALEKLSMDGLDLRLAICQGLIQAFIGIGSPECIQEANDLTSYMETEVGDKPVVLHWRLEILQKSPDEVFEPETYSSILRRMTRSFGFSDGTLNFLLYHIKELRDKNSRLACGVMDELLKQRVLPSGNAEWIGKSIVRRIWMSMGEIDSDDAVIDLKKVLDFVLDATFEPLNPDVAGASHSLIWKRVDSLFAKKQHKIAEQWCSIALHEVFSSCGEANQGKFGRKLILCALELSNTERAKAAFHLMPESAQNDMLTRYLMFRVSLSSWDCELGCESIQHLSKCADKAKCQDILYACIREAQHVGDKICTLEALKVVAESWDANKTSAANLPPILRCTIHFIHKVEADEEVSEVLGQKTVFVEDLCRTYEKAAEHAKLNLRDQEGNKMFTVVELNWFRKNAYNTGVEKCNNWELAFLIRMFSTCLAFIECYPSDIPLKDVAEMALMSMRCHFVIAAALIAVARTEDNVEQKLQRYLEMRDHVAAFDVQLQTEVAPQDDAIVGDLRAKSSTLFVFDFEAAVCLKNWDDLNQIVRKAEACNDEVMYKAMGDCLLRSQAPGRVMFATMQLIVNEIHELENYDNEKMFKYIRCMFQAILPSDDDAALQLIEKAVQIARESREVRNPLPNTELEWLASSTFNHAIDCYSRGDNAPCHAWAFKAMTLAEYMEDGGGLKRVLQDNFARLRFDAEPRRS